MYFNVLANNKLLFVLDQPVKNKQEARKKIWLDYLYHQNCYKLIGINLSRQTNLKIPQKTNFTRNLDEDNAAAIFFVTQKQLKTILKLSFH